MVFSSITFLFFFLPSVLVLYLVAGVRARNILLLVASLFFYAWGEGVYLMLMLVSVAVNYLAGRLIGAAGSRFQRKFWLILGVTLNLLLLGYFKYANFVTDNLNVLFAMVNMRPVDLAPIRLPIGISFFTFQALSYIIDVFRKEVRTILFISLCIFPCFLNSLLARLFAIGILMIRLYREKQELQTWQVVLSVLSLV